MRGGIKMSGRGVKNFMGVYRSESHNNKRSVISRKYGKRFIKLFRVKTGRQNKKILRFNQYTTVKRQDTFSN